MTISLLFYAVPFLATRNMGPEITKHRSNQHSLCWRVKSWPLDRGNPSFQNLTSLITHVYYYYYFLSESGNRVSGLVTKLCLTLATPWTVAHQAPPSMGFSRQEYWSGVPFNPLRPFPKSINGRHFEEMLPHAGKKQGFQVIVSRGRWCHPEFMLVFSLHKRSAWPARSWAICSKVICGYYHYHLVL